MAWDYFYAKQVVGPYRILACTERGKRQKDTLYQVETACCGKAASVTHECIAKAVRRGVQRCVRCARATRSAVLLRKRAKELMGGPPDGVVVISGHWWPALGALGPRYGTSGAQTERPSSLR